MGISVLINGKRYEFDDSLDYINKLEQLCVEIEKRKQSVPIKVAKREIEINGSDHMKMPQPTIKQEPSRPLYQGRITSPDIRIVGNTTKKEEMPTVTKRAIPIDPPKKIETSSSKAINTGKIVQPSLIGKYPAIHKEIPVNPEYDMTEARKGPILLKQEYQSEKTAESTNKAEKPKVDIVAAQKEEMKSKPGRTKVDRNKLRKIREERVNLVSLDPHEILTVDESNDLKNVSIILAPVSLIDKTENIFYDNVEMIKKYAESTKIGTLVLGKVTTMEKAAKEVSKIMKLCNNTNYELICYEVNNEKIINLEPEELIEAIKTVEQICDVLTNEGYKVLVSADLGVRNKLVNNNFQTKYPLLARISPKEVAQLDENVDCILMDPTTPNDEVLLTAPTARYLVSSNKLEQASSLRKAA